MYNNNLRLTMYKKTYKFYFKFDIQSDIEKRKDGNQFAQKAMQQRTSKNVKIL